MSWWRAKYKNDHGEYEITFGSKYRERAKAVEKVCQAVIDKLVKSPEDIAVVVRCKDCAYCEQFANYHGAPKYSCKKRCFDSEVEPEEFCSHGERRADNG